MHKGMQLNGPKRRILFHDDGLSLTYVVGLRTKTSLNKNNTTNRANVLWYMYDKSMVPIFGWGYLLDLQSIWPLLFILGSPLGFNIPNQEPSSQAQLIGM